MTTKEDYAEKLSTIYEMIENSKSQIKDNAFFYLLWGWLVLIASLSHFLLLKLHYYHYDYLPWPVIMTAGGIISVIAGIRLGKRSKVRTHLDTAIIFLWWGFLFALFILLAYAIAGKISWAVTNPLIISLYGSATFISGGILKFRPLIIGGMASWVIALAGFFVPEDYTLLLVSISVIVAYLIPGYLLKRKTNHA